MGYRIEIGKIADTIAKELAGYTKDVAEEVKKASDEVSKKLLADIKADAPKKTGAYKKAMKVEKMYEDDYEKRNRWCVDPKTGEYRLSHLLEYGHLKRDGINRVKAYPHIGENEQKAVEEFERRLKEAIENAGK